jgi:type 1 glutamine amidotransferase
VREIIGWEDISSDITDDLEGGLAGLETAAYELLTVNTSSSSLSESGRLAVSAHLARGGGILVVQPASGSFENWAEWPGIVGAEWHRQPAGASNPGPVQVSVRTSAHPITAGLGSFEVVDAVPELVTVGPDVEPLASITVEGEDHPVLWAREVGGGRVVYDGLGHDERSFSHPAHRIILCRSARWLLGLPAERDEQEWLELGDDPDPEEEEEQPS